MVYVQFDYWGPVGHEELNGQLIAVDVVGQAPEQDDRLGRSQPVVRVEDECQQLLETLRPPAAGQRGQHGRPVGPLCREAAVRPNVVPFDVLAVPDGRTQNRLEVLADDPRPNKINELKVKYIFFKSTESFGVNPKS